MLRTSHPHFLRTYAAMRPTEFLCLTKKNSIWKLKYIVDLFDKWREKKPTFEVQNSDLTSDRNIWNKNCFNRLYNVHANQKENRFTNCNWVLGLLCFVKWQTIMNFFYWLLFGNRHFTHACVHTRMAKYTSYGNLASIRIWNNAHCSNKWRVQKTENCAQFEVWHVLFLLLANNTVTGHQNMFFVKCKCPVINHKPHRAMRACVVFEWNHVHTKNGEFQAMQCNAHLHLLHGAINSDISFNKNIEMNDLKRKENEYVKHRSNCTHAVWVSW